MRPDRDAAPRRLAQGREDGQGVAGVKATGNVGGADDREHCRVVPHPPGPEAFAKIAVEIHGHFSRQALRKAKIVLIDRSPMYQVNAQTMTLSASSGRL